MFDDTRDLNRDLGRRDGYLNDPAVSDGSGYAPLIALAAIALIVGGLFWFAPSDNTQVATNNPAVTRPAPAPAPMTPPAKAIRTPTRARSCASTRRSACCRKARAPGCFD